MDGPGYDGPKLSAFDATLLVMGGIVGVGIFFTPQTVAQRSGDPVSFLILWVIGGAIALSAAFTFAELGASFPRAGGWFVFLREAYGPFPAFLFAWIVLFVVSTGALAAMTGFCASMLHEAWPELFPPGGTRGHLGVAGGIILGGTGLTLFGVRRAALFQNLCMGIKLFGILGLFLAGMLWAAPEVVEATTSGEGSGEAAPAGWLAGLFPVLFSYGGWQMICYLAPAVRDPERTLPRTIAGGVCGVVVIYLLLNLAFLRGLGLEGIAAERTFASRMAESALGDGGERVLSAAMAISALGVCAVTVMATPWLYVAMSREGLFFETMGRLHARTGAPVAALALQAVVALVYLFLGTLQEIVDSVIFVEWMFHGLVAISLLRLRRLRPELPRPFHSPLYPLAPIVYALAATMVVAGVLWNAEPRLKWTGLSIVAAGALVYRPWRALFAER